ncbi:hypothetical protein B0I35DRAFT_13809 [Stachybotrys elegans]|uniref:Secreted protein n=1 Tax=Stachybotrys elegans TaxID=80388 RepID=A0A8K0WWK6_9HYPO|nr:hypothetical protein B0I35DRAFT_13809 [Stachybotrys elegans]
MLAAPLSWIPSLSCLHEVVRLLPWCSLVGAICPFPMASNVRLPAGRSRSQQHVGPPALYTNQIRLHFWVGWVAACLPISRLLPSASDSDGLTRTVASSLSDTARCYPRGSSHDPSRHFPHQSPT